MFMTKMTALELIVKHYNINKIYTDEASLLDDAVGMLELIGAYVLRKDAFVLKGFPDLYICYEGRFIAIELKDNTGKLSPHQEKQIQKIRRAGGIAGGCRTLEEIIELIF